MSFNPKWAKEMRDFVAKTMSEERFEAFSRTLSEADRNEMLKEGYLYYPWIPYFQDMNAYLEGFVAAPDLQRNDFEVWDEPDDGHELLGPASNDDSGIGFRVQAPIAPRAAQVRDTRREKSELVHKDENVTYMCVNAYLLHDKDILIALDGTFEVVFLPREVDPASIGLRVVISTPRDKDRTMIFHREIAPGVSGCVQVRNALPDRVILLTTAMAVSGSYGSSEPVDQYRQAANEEQATQDAGDKPVTFNLTYTLWSGTNESPLSMVSEETSQEIGSVAVTCAPSQVKQKATEIRKNQFGQFTGVVTVRITNAFTGVVFVSHYGR